VLADEWSLQAGTLAVDTSKGADLAVVVLDEATSEGPAVLPQADSVEALARRAPVTSVGYGYSSRGADGTFVYDRLRRSASSPVLKAGRLTLTISTKSAGPCMGDSGGPQLAGDTVLSVTSTGSKDCAGRAEGYRLDTTQARAFLSGFVALP
ncbi:MAG: S1 family peptidase, partial [Actinomycetota bacterium]|nr:S1 family peptidase [Actinomycetota bacterium]